ncbi:acyl-CoA thioesterase [Staphylococcus pseudoxylosus]|uniref:acyl-CoA thioesterase n=1 Tax=Staphylococcus pseudoxylosus TaxID=2282419 RepID=UPI002DBDE054|nr:acyl-CoA thioesterase [Staphylococcus pseudoxylosus]MEB6037750.1 acyl-CoA thioesterase [Staphylococcus pseudoxylosus]MEB6046229.1 acyl-CoA thioesterase [Staphylococcus pseudoxylosus]MEB6061992.1 acyl-CoA thioesterase [Staphylococcus pseudoxylosus]MEB7765017.1 acyl-CoA thioesterase [Staphylococcus pseudoxylosus]MEB8009999.1 acyl-CoA thioesterase [Staphylococcus pseudoxylosus]
MGNVKRKSMSASRSVKERQVFPQDTNHLHTMFGGMLMANVDEISAITATKHSNSQVVTASTDSVDFLKPIKTGDIVSYEAMVSYAGQSSMEICVQIIIEDIIRNERHLAALSFLTFVALDEDGKPQEVPQVYPETQTEMWFHDTALARVKRRKERRNESKETIAFLANAQNMK